MHARMDAHTCHVTVCVCACVVCASVCVCVRECMCVQVYKNASRKYVMDVFPIKLGIIRR